MLVIRAKVGERGQIVIPKPIRDMFQIKPGEEMLFSIRDDEILIQKKEGKELLKRMRERFKKKQDEPEAIDWKGIYESQHEA